MRKRALLLLAAVAVFATVPAAAQDEGGIKIFGGMAYITPMSDSELSGDTVEATSELGYTLGLEWRWGKLFGLEFDVIDATHDVEVDGQTVGDVGFMPISASLNFHLLPGKNFDLYVAPTVSYVDWGNIELNGGGEVPTDSEFAYGAQVGIDIGGEHLKFTGALRWLSVDVSADGDDVGVDPIITRLGIAWKF